MNSNFKKFCLSLGWRAPLIRGLSSRRPVILVYHRIPVKRNGPNLNDTVFEKQILFLKHHFQIVSPVLVDQRRSGFGKIRVLLTLDDGFLNQAIGAMPVLRKHQVPAIFFVSSRHTVPGKYLWFAYLEALETHFKGNGFYFRGDFINMSTEKRCISMLQLRETLLKLEPHPLAMYDAIENELPPLEDIVHSADLLDNFAGMTEEQMGEIAADPLFTIGIHTMDHPFLTKCTPEETKHQIVGNKTWIEQISGKPCKTIAYPAGDYNAGVLRQCRELGLTEGHALVPLVGAQAQLELPRVGIYSASLEFLGFKIQWGNAVRFIQSKLN